MKLRDALIFRLLTGIAAGIVVGIAAAHYDMTTLLRAIKTAEELFGEFLKFLIPLIILGFVTPGIIDIGGRAGRMLLITVSLALGSTLVGGFAAYAAGSALSGFITGGALSTADGSLIKPAFTIAIPPALPVFTALVLSFLLGLALAGKRESVFARLFMELKDIMDSVIRRVIIPVLPFYIGSLFVSLSASGRIVPILSSFGRLYLVIIALQLAFIALEYAAAGIVTKRKPLVFLKNMLPAYLTAFGTQSSAATLPVTLQCVRENGVEEDVVDFVIPLCATIHLLGDMIMITIASIALYAMQGGVPSLSLFVPFIFLLSVTMIAAPGIPGGGAMTALGLLGEMLAFNGFQKGLMLSLHMAQDSFGTATNVTADGAIVMLVEHMSGGKKDAP